MLRPTYDSIYALAQAILRELEKTRDDSKHGTLQLSCICKYLSNGVKYSCIQIECEACCGWLIEAYGREAEALEQKALAIRRMIQIIDTVQHSLSDILLTIFPEFVIERKNNKSVIRYNENYLNINKKNELQ